MSKTKVKRCYFVYEVGENLGYSVVAKDAREAKKIAISLLWDIDYIDIRVQWKRRVDITKYPPGHVFEGEDGLLEGLRIGAYSHLENIPCPRCGDFGYIEMEKGEPLCTTCIEQEEPSP